MKRLANTSLALLGAVIAAACEATPQHEASASTPCGTEAPTASADGATPDSRFISIGADSLHYFDFGGEGLQVVLTAGTRPASVWTGFAPRLTGCGRVVAVTDRGFAPSSGEFGNTERRANDILVLLDSLDIDRAVVIANANPSSVLLHLGEHHPNRLAGLVFLAPASEEGSDLTFLDSEAARMLARANASMQGQDPDGVDEMLEEFRRTQEVWEWPEFEVPALTFVNLGGTRGIEGVVVFTQLAQQLVDSTGVIPEARVPDSISRAYLTRLATDPVLQAEVERAWDSVAAPIMVENERAFFDAFGDHIRTVRIDAPMMGRASVVSGYEFRDAPELVDEHVRAFLDDVRSGDPDGGNGQNR